jgi:hypothetical protein
MSRQSTQSAEKRRNDSVSPALNDVPSTGSCRSTAAGEFAVAARRNPADDTIAAAKAVGRSRHRRQRGYTDDGHAVKECTDAEKFELGGNS